MYSYDGPAAPRRSTTASRAIPGMRPSYDAEHPHSATPIYDELYSEYRRLFRALPGDRSGEEELAFTGFAVRDAAPTRTDPRPYPPQHQSFHTYAGQAIGIPQFMPGRPGGADHSGQSDQGFAHTGGAPHPGNPGHPGHPHDHGPAHASHTAGHPASPYTTGFQAAPSPGRPPGAPTSPHSAGHAGSGQTGTGHAGAGQGWVAAGYLGTVPPPVSAHVPAPAPVTVPVPAPAPAVGTAFGAGDRGTTGGGRHRSLLSLPPGRSGEHH
ncbi:hypothetical protein ACFVFS_32935 [Kitasatospora sp. NPDC057692]|uniref:hypothetical protein n=1 Tax=Kitasatospora sp. NPDC057692 TaxID=3346215 RepID=UPI0036A13AE6